MFYLAPNGISLTSNVRAVRRKKIISWSSLAALAFRSEQNRWGSHSRISLSTTSLLWRNDRKVMCGGCRRSNRSNTPLDHSFLIQFNCFQLFYRSFHFFKFQITSLIIWITARISPFESASIDGNSVVSFSNQFTMFNSFWFTVSSLMQQVSYYFLRPTLSYDLSI